MNLNIAALLEAAEYLERRERGKKDLSLSLLFLFRSYFFLFFSFLLLFLLLPLSFHSVSLKLLNNNPLYCVSECDILTTFQVTLTSDHHGVFPSSIPF